MFFFFSFLVSSEYWFFNARHKDRIVANSFEKPLFIIGYSPYCGHCTNVPNESIIFRNLTDNRTDFYFTLLNCAESDGCNHFRVPYTPYIVMVRGNNQEYWPETKSHNATGWLEFVEEQLKPKTTELTNENLDLLENSKENLKKGGSIFVLQVKSNSSSLLKEYKDLANRNYIFNDYFFYKIEPKMTQKLTVYQSPNCKYETYDVQQFPALIEEYKFGSMHKYSKEEMIKLKQQNINSSLIFVEESYGGAPILDVHFDELAELADMYCFSMKTGWTSLKSGDDFLRENKIYETDMPMMVFQSPNCINKYLGRIGDTYETDFYSLSISGQICNTVYNNYDGSENITSFEPLKEVKEKKYWWNTTVKGWYISLGIFLYFFALLLYSAFVLKKTPTKVKNG